MARFRTCALMLALSLAGVAGHAQPSENTLERGTVVSQILTIDRQRFLFESAFGKRIRSEADAEEQKLASENSQIQADLEAEEKNLTARRSTMPPEEFRALADAFDLKVQATRKAQDDKIRALNQSLNKQLDALESAAFPVLEQLMRDAGAAVILELPSVFLSARFIDITDEAITRLDGALGDGSRP